MRMLILAGGFGTRLQSVVADVPKALAPVDSVPFLYFQIEHWISQGIRSFVFLLHYQADLIIDFLKAREMDLLKECTVEWLVEPSPMDTGGAVAYAVQELNISGKFILTNADTWLSSGVETLARSDANTMAIVCLQDVERYGQVRFDECHRATAFREKGGSKGEGWINAGMCLLEADYFKSWDGLPFSLERDFFTGLLARGELKVIPLQTDFVDIGIPADYLKFCQWYKTGCRGKLCS